MAATSTTMASTAGTSSTAVCRSRKATAAVAAKTINAIRTSTTPHDAGSDGGGESIVGRHGRIAPHPGGRSPVGPCTVRLRGSTLAGEPAAGGCHVECGGGDDGTAPSPRRAPGAGHRPGQLALDDPPAAGRRPRGADPRVGAPRRRLAGRPRHRRAARAHRADRPDGRARPPGAGEPRRRPRCARRCCGCWPTSTATSRSCATSRTTTWRWSSAAPSSAPPTAPPRLLPVPTSGWHEEGCRSGRSEPP